MKQIEKFNANKKMKKSSSDRIFLNICTVVLALLMLIVLIPLLNIVASSFSDPKAVSSGKVWLFPVDFSLKSYKNVLKYDSVWLGYRNTIFYTFVGTVMNVIVTLLCAFPLSQHSFAGRKFVNKLLFFTMIFSGGMIPGYLLVKQLKMLNSIWAVLLPGLMSAYNVIITRNYIETNIPRELEEAARVDGCSPAKYFTNFVLPLSKSIIAVITMYYAVGHWNSYFNAFLYLNDRDLYPLQLFLRDILVNSKFDSSIIDDPEMAQVVQAQADALKYSIIVIATLPLMCVYPLVQKHFVKGVMIGSVKG
ncbi:MAG: carbohydrate ABC transporter permease [Lachnospiraceae bacterium]|nr:carbohydrate ABC transporter permease [Lachnospiraceae bacterium]